MHGFSSSNCAELRPGVYGQVGGFSRWWTQIRGVCGHGLGWGPSKLGCHIPGSKNWKSPNKKHSLFSSFPFQVFIFYFLNSDPTIGLRGWHHARLCAAKEQELSNFVPCEHTCFDSGLCRGTVFKHNSGTIHTHTHTPPPDHLLCILYTHIHTHAPLCTLEHSAHTHACMHTLSTHTCTHAHTHTNTSIHAMHAHTHTHTRTWNAHVHFFAPQYTCDTPHTTSATLLLSNNGSFSLSPWYQEWRPGSQRKHSFLTTKLTSGLKVELVSSRESDKPSKKKKEKRRKITTVFLQLRVWFEIIDLLRWEWCWLVEGNQGVEVGRGGGGAVESLWITYSSICCGECDNV